MSTAANMTTALRALLLPIPIWMLYQQTSFWTSLALAAFVVVGLTDVLDGIVARRFGSDALGRALDGIVDRIFLVAVYVSFSDLGIIPRSAALILLLRELAMRSFRGWLTVRGIPEQASFLGKLKTTTEFAGAGFVLLLRILGEHPLAPWLLALPPGMALVYWIVSTMRGRRSGPWASWGSAFMGFVWLVRWVAGTEGAVIAIMTMVVGIALLSAAQALWRARRELMEELRRSPASLAVGAAARVFIPGLYLLLIGRSELLTLVAGVVVGSELTIAGIDNVLAGLAEPVHQTAVRFAWLAIGIGVLLSWPTPVERELVVLVIGLLLIVTELLATATRFRRMQHRLAV